MAYRQLLALACVSFGLASAACGSDGGNVAIDKPEQADDLPARASDQAPGNTDQAAASKDQPPPATDQPAGGPAPVGDDDAAAEAQCQEFCDGLDDASCPGSGANAVTRQICGSNCVITAQIRPCVSQVLELMTCLAGLDGLCTEDGPSDAAAARCQAASEGFGTCLEGGGDGPAPQTCSSANGCATCDGLCEICKCTAPGNAACDVVCD